MSLIYNATFDSQTRVLSLLDKAGNVISSCEVPSKELVDDITKPLTFKATQDNSTVKLSKTGSPYGAFQTSRDGGNTWTNYTMGSKITLNTGDEVSFRAKDDRSSQNSGNYFQFKMTGKIEAWHNVMSMYRTNDFATYNTVGNFAFYQLFFDCTSLVKAPVLPATTLAWCCYYNMFKGCTSLTEAPELPATALNQDCYYYMFDGCTSLTEAPALPATTLAEKCYRRMFNNCTSLTKAPALSATTLANACYYEMFYGCSSLNEVRCKVPSSYSSSYTYNWLSGVSSTGKFYTNADANWPSGASGIPENWTRVNEREKDDVTEPLTFKATQDGSTVKLTKTGSPSGSFQTSSDGGNTWTDYTLDTAITLNTGDEVSFRAKADRTSAQYIQHYFYFKMTGKIEAWNNLMSLYRTNDFATYNTVGNYAFIYMFQDCKSLTKAPALPVTTLADSCYQFMFYGCTSLTEAPKLPVTTLARKCYSGMFKGCTSLTEAPALPATTLARNCYESMFEGCTSLTKAPVLPATTLADSCYYYMFEGCSSLNEVRCQMSSSYIPGDISALYANRWLEGVSSTGTFHTNADANWPSGISGIPTGWTRVNEETPAVDDITKPLTFKATQDGSTVKLTEKGSPTGSFQTSTDGGNTWVDYAIGTDITLNIGDKVSFRAKTDRTSKQTSSSYFSFQMTGKIEAWHSIMSLYRTADFATYKSVVDYAFACLFRDGISLTKAPLLPATTLADSCYWAMFRSTSLTKAPELPATALATDCYYEMFLDCRSLKEVRVSATTTATRALYNWLSSVSATGDFYCDPNATIFPTDSTSGIPSGWSRKPLSDYPNP